ncbi:MAG TPA: 3'-5' exonuclease, partial [Aggregatilineales bacterium]|nr:3'-5' exonuclease [Aggregatilineales bacterium]
LEEGILPHSRSLEDAEQMSEERRLMYVGVTRAKDMLFLTWAFRRSVYNDGMRSMPSRFLTDIPGDLTTGSSLPRHALAGRQRDSYRRTTTWETPTTARRVTPVHTTRYRSGQRVRHVKFGEGMVITSKVRGDDEEVEVSFLGVGVKRLSANLANLVTLEETPEKPARPKHNRER